MKPVEQITACVIDRGTFFPIAERLARDYKRVLYHKPDGEPFVTVGRECLGAGLPEVEYVEDFWEFKNEIDLFVFPDCADWGLQKELERQGFPVWGSKDSGKLEQYRGRWIEFCQKNGLPMPRTDTVRGLTNLKRFLDEHRGEKWFVKISRFRGDMETWEAKTPQQIANKLDYLSLRFGPLREHVLFYVQQGVETDIEAGTDTYDIHGQWPDDIILGYEKKAESYFATVKPRKSLPDVLWSGNEAVEDMMRDCRYANFVSSEIRVKDDTGYWLDPCFRMPSPAGEEQLEMYANFDEIVWNGAQGILVQPQWAAKFCGEAVIAYNGDRDTWKSVEVPEEISRWIKLYAAAYADGVFHFPPCQDHDAIGCAVAIGNNPNDVLENLKGLAEAMKDQPVTLRIEPMADLFTEIEKAETEGIAFTKKEMPQPADVLEGA